MELDSIVQMALAGLGSGIVPMGRVSPDVARNLRIFPFGEPQVHRHVMLVQRKGTSSSEYSNCCIKKCSRNLRNDVSRFFSR